MKTLNKKKQTLEEKIENFENKKSNSKLNKKLPPSLVAIAGRASTEIIAGILFGVFLGWFLDSWLETKPIFTIIFLVFGFLAGLMNLWRFLSGKDMALGFINQKENVKKNK